MNPSCILRLDHLQTKPDPSTNKKIRAIHIIVLNRDASCVFANRYVSSDLLIDKATNYNDSQDTSSMKCNVVSEATTATMISSILSALFSYFTARITAVDNKAT